MKKSTRGMLDPLIINILMREKNMEINNTKYVRYTEILVL